jgi:glycine cleavage system H protein
MVPSDRKYSKEHEWVQIGEDGTATVGITQFAQDQLGDIVFVELPGEGDEVNKDDVIGTIESVKAVSEIFAPISGTIVGINSDLEETPESVNKEPYVSGWYCKMSVGNSDEVDALLDAGAYSELTAED